MLAVRPSVEADIPLILADVHPLDADELRVLGHTARESIEFGFGRSQWCVTALAGERPVCMCGVIEYAPRKGVLWIMTTKEIEQNKGEFVRASIRIMRELRERYDSLQNRIDSRNAPLVNWVRMLGFALDPPEPIGPEAAPFIRYHWTAPCVPA